MSVSSILGLVLFGTKAFTGPRDKAEERPNRTRNSELVLELGELKTKVAELEDAIATLNAQSRRDQELIDLWRERALFAEAPQGAIRPAGPDFRPPQIAQQQAQAAQMQAAATMAQCNAQQALNAQNQLAAAQQNLGQAIGQLGAQSLIDAELWCNCVPARHDMFLRGH